MPIVILMSFLLGLHVTLPNLFDINSGRRLGCRSTVIADILVKTGLNLPE